MQKEFDEWKGRDPMTSDIRRRKVLAASGSFEVAWPLATRAQQTAWF
jgi:hypothetical protein